MKQLVVLIIKDIITAQANDIHQMLMETTSFFRSQLHCYTINQVCAEKICYLNITVNEGLAVT